MTWCGAFRNIFNDFTLLRDIELKQNNIFFPSFLYKQQITTK